MKIYSFDGKKRIIDSFDDCPSPLYLGRKFAPYDINDTQAQEIQDTEEKPIEKSE